MPQPDTATEEMTLDMSQLHYECKPDRRHTEAFLHL